MHEAMMDRGRSAALTVPEACREARLGRSSLYNAIKRGELRARKFGRRTLILRKDFDAFLSGLPVTRDVEG